MKVTILGCGGAIGVPSVTGDWGKCDPNNPKNRRMRASICIDGNDGTRIIVDTGPDFHRQMCNLGWNGRLDGVLFSHEHSDHIMGMDDLRYIAITTKQPVDIYTNEATLKQLKQSFGYAFAKGDYDFYPQIIKPHPIEKEMKIGCFTVQSFDQKHGKGITTGFRIGDFAYSTDAAEFPEESLAVLAGVKVWVVDMTHYDNSGIHAGKNTVLEWIEKIKPEKVFLTHLNCYLDYEALCREMPEHIRPCYDGMVIEL